MGDVTIEFELDNGKIQSLNDFARFLKTFILIVYDMMNILIDIFAVGNISNIHDAFISFGIQNHYIYQMPYL